MTVRFTVVIPWETPPKARPRVTGSGVFTPSADDEAAAGMMLARAFPDRQPWTFPIGVTAIFHRATAHRVDLDNLLKLVLDAGNEIVYDDDSQVHAIVARMVLRSDNPRTELTFEML